MSFDGINLENIKFFLFVLIFRSELQNLIQKYLISGDFLKLHSLFKSLTFRLMNLINLILI